MNIKLYRKDTVWLSKDRQDILQKNAKELERRINIETGELLEYLVDYNVITQKDKDFIMVRIFFLPFHVIK